MKRINEIKIDATTQFAVIGLGNFGMALTKVLSKNGFNVLVCDNDPQKIHEVAEFVTQVIEGDVNDPAVIKSIGLEDFDVVIIAISGDFETSIITTMITKEKGVPLIISKANDWRQEKILLDVGADQVIMPQKEMGEKLALSLISNNPFDKLYTTDEYNIIEIHPKQSWIGKSLKELDLRKKYDINVIAVVRDHLAIPILDPDFIIKNKDILVVIGVAE